MKKKNFFKKKKTFIIAEIGNNHEGSLKNAFKLVDEAAKAKVDAVKFQTFKTENFIHPSNKSNFKKFKKFELSREDFNKLFKYVKSKKLYLISTPLDIESAFFLKKHVDVFKISSGDNNFYDLINLVMNFKKPTIISNGFLSISETIHLVKKIKRINNNICLLHCISSYPVNDKNASLKNIQTLIAKLKIPIGYSDHTLGVTASILAVALGAQVLEKHFTLSNNFSSFRDHQLSLNPKNMQRLVQEIRRSDQMLGFKDKKFIDNEKTIYPLARRSLYYNTDIKKGKIINKKNLIYLRSLKKNNFNKLNNINKKATKDCLKYDNF